VGCTSAIRKLQMAALLFIICLFVQMNPVQASSAISENVPLRIEWDAYYLGEAPDGPQPSQWSSIALLDSALNGASESELWLRADIPQSQHSTSQLLVYSYIVRDFEISLSVNGTQMYKSDKVLPSGFITWKIIAYENASYKHGSELVARISPLQNLEGFEVWSGDASALSLMLLRMEAPMWAGAIVLALLSAISLLLYLFNRKQTLFVYFSIFFSSIAIDLAVLWGGWQYVFQSESLMILGGLIHFNWYIGYAIGILITYSIVGGKWVRRIGHGGVVYALVAMTGWLLFGDSAQLLFYQLFYDYISTCMLLVIAYILIRALLLRRNREVTIFAIGNGLFVAGLVLGRGASGQLGLFPTTRAILTSELALAQVGWMYIGFGGTIICCVIIMVMRLMNLTRLRLTNKELEKVNDELKNANEKLSRIDEIRSNMYSEVSHELNTPITAIKGYVQLMLKGTIPAGETHYLQIIHDQSAVMERMIDDMLEIARLENNSIPFEFELIPFVELYTRLCTKVQLDMLEQGFAYTWTLMPELDRPDQEIVIYADPVRVEQVFSNLLSNARKFTPVGGSIRIEASMADSDASSQSVVIRFMDSGCGISEQEQQHIFERYYRGQAAKSGSVMGTGLGLPICHEIMKAHHGEVGLECSTSEGSMFYIRFPLRHIYIHDFDHEEESN
jgi:signal transduction histidine kinase